MTQLVQSQTSESSATQTFSNFALGGLIDELEGRGRRDRVSVPAPKAFARPLFHILSSAHVATLVRILIEHGGCSPRRIGQVALMLATSLAREPGYALEAIRVAKRARAVRFDPPPVIILGHWRSGTTFLHNLMSRDPRFCFPTIVDAAMPHEFYPGPIADMSRKLLLRNMPAVRQVDDIPLRSELPQEDEIALATMGSPSFFNCFYFPRDFMSVFRREVLFEDLGPSAKRRWRRDLVHYLAKIVALTPDRRLLLKNPAHSARVNELKALFPGAKFVHIHRDPFDVFVSMRRLLKVTFSIVALQDYDEAEIDEHILTIYPLVMNRLFEGLDAVAPGDRSEVRYADLVREPVETVARLYRDLDLGDFDAAHPAVADFAESGAVSPRSARLVDTALMERITQRWHDQIVRLGYDGRA